MTAPMRVLIAASEAVPYAKTGGLADVVGALPRALRRLGIEADIVIPLHRSVDDPLRFPLMEENVSLKVPMGAGEEWGTMEQLAGTGDGPRVFLLRQPRYFGREFLYGTREGDYLDNCERFSFFCRAVMEWVRKLPERYDVIHGNDWQTGLIPAYMKTLYADDPAIASAASVFTVHNLGYQGLFWNHDLPMTGLSWDLFTPKGVEFFGQLNLLKAGLVFTDALTTVSETYSREIQTPEFGYGLEGVLYERRVDLYGIVNGVDYEDWDPSTDPHIAANYSAADLSGKRRCREDLLAEFGWPADVKEPLLGMVGRLAAQKGFDLYEQAAEWLVDRGVRVVVLGSGERRFEEALGGLAARFPDRIAVRIAHDNALAHKVEAGADLFLMPSRYEPCGLNQIYSLRYGTVPVVRRTGGLADTVVDADDSPEGGTGFAFRGYDATDLQHALHRALVAFDDRPRWDAIVARGMAADFSWDASAKRYADVYAKVLARKARGR